MLDVIGAGFGRTGTASLKVALEHLGLGPCHHMFEVVAHPELLPRWERVVAGEDVDWDEVLEGYRSTVDWPGCAYWRELMETYPHAKVILTVRDPERWYDSAYDTIYQFAAETGGDPQEDDVVAGLQRMRPMVEKLIWEAPSMTASRTGHMPSGSSPSTTPRFDAACPATACWSTRWIRAGSRCASTSGWTSPPTRSRTSTKASRYVNWCRRCWPGGDCRHRWIRCAERSDGCLS